MCNFWRAHRFVYIYLLLSIINIYLKLHEIEGICAVYADKLA